MSSTYKKVFLAYSSLYLIVFSIALMYMLRFIFSFTSLFHSWNWTNFKGILIVIVILILQFTILLIKKLTERRKIQLIVEQPILDIQNLNKEYESEAGIISVLTGINLKFYKSEIVSIMGPSGSENQPCLGLWDP